MEGEERSELAANLLAEVLVVREGLRLREISEREALRRLESIRKRRLMRVEEPKEIIFRVFNQKGRDIATFVDEKRAYALANKFNFRVEPCEVAA